MRKHGADVLLGNALKNFFTDYAPGIAALRKNVVFFVSTSGAADILKRKTTATANEREIAFKQAVQKVIDTYGTERSLAESVISEFTDALGWNVSVQTQTPPATQKQQPRPQAPQERQTIPAARTSPAQSVGNLAAGQRNVRFGRYNWRVLDVQDGKALLLAEKILERQRYHSSATGVTWETCDLRGYLNGEFFQTFSGAEQSCIAPSKNENPDNQWFGTAGGNSTTDKVFLLSIDEVVKYFGDSGQLRKRPMNTYWIDDQYNSARKANYKNETWAWWLRSPGYSGNSAAAVDYVGGLRIHGGVGNYDEIGVRPALWLNL
jgi:hypothetical protein